jgi:hypothetical protein
LVTKEIIEIKIIIIITSEYNFYLKTTNCSILLLPVNTYQDYLFISNISITPTNGCKMKEKNQKHTTPSETGPMPSPGYKC